MNTTLKSTPEGNVFDLKQTKMLKQISEDSPSKMRVFEKAYSTKSLRAAITAMCLQCVWMDTRAIRECTDTSCPLWNVRPFQTVRGK